MPPELSRAERRRQAREDEKLLARGIDPEIDEPQPAVAMARALSVLFEEAKRNKNIDPPVGFLYDKANATLARLKHIPVACAKGCAHCCYIRVSVSAPELLFTAKVVRQRGAALAARVAAAHQGTKDYDLLARARHPYPCPMLESEICSIYPLRPLTCRFAASADAAICSRSYRQLSNENIPTPLLNVNGRNAYALSVVIALKHVGLPHHSYEFNAGLARALAVEDAEAAWLSGEDIFAYVPRDPEIMSQPSAQQAFRLAFG